jgi:hypothetical protein
MYSIGICKLVRDDGAVIQHENKNNVTYVLGQLNQANLVGGGKLY